MAMTGEQFAKLPKYAKDELVRKVREIETLQRQLADLQNSRPETDVFIEHGSGAVQYLDAVYGVHFRLGANEKTENEIRVSIEKHPVVGNRLQIMAIGYPSTLHIVPQSSNVVAITTDRY